jgi:branched-chain amino acid transport system substrate-binding protein
MKMRPNFMSVAGYDGMAAIYLALGKTGGDPEAGKFMAAIKGAKWASPRGIVQTVYVRRTELVDGKICNVEFDKFPDRKDPGK